MTAPVRFLERKRAKKNVLFAAKALPQQGFVPNNER